MPRILSITGHESSSSSPRCAIRYSSVYMEILMTIIYAMKVVSFLAGFMTESQKVTLAIFGGSLTTVLLVCIFKLYLCFVLTIWDLHTNAFDL